MEESQKPPKVRVAAVQMEPKLGRIEANLERIIDRIASRRAGGRSAGGLSRVRAGRLRIRFARRGHGTRGDPRPARPSTA